MNRNFGFQKLIAGLIAVFFTWQTATAYSFPGITLIPKAIASVESNAGTPTGKTVLFVLNAHTSSDAQKNIAELLKFFQSQGIDLIGLEGADDKIDGKIFRDFSDKDSLAKASWQMVKEGIFTGAEYFYITADKLPHFYGLEDRGLYFENRDAFIDTFKSREALKPALESLTHSLLDLKKKTYSKKLAEFDQMNFLYKEGNLGFMDYLNQMAQAAKQARVSLSAAFPNFYSLSKSVEKERQINKKGLQKDLVRIREMLQPSHTSVIASPIGAKQSQDQGLLRRPDGLLAMTENDIDESIFSFLRGEGENQKPQDDLIETYQKIHAYFSKLIEEGKIDPKELKDFSNYYHWIDSFTSFDPKQLFEELESLTDQMYGKLAKSDKEKVLVGYSRQFEAFEKMISVELTQKEWEGIKERTATGKNERSVILSPEGTKDLALRFFAPEGAQNDNAALSRNDSQAFDIGQTLSFIQRELKDRDS